MPTTVLESILLDTSSMLDIALEVDSAHATTGALRTWYFTFQGRETGAAETPASSSFYPFLRPESFTSMSQGLSEDFHFSGLASLDAGTITLIEPSPLLGAAVLEEFFEYRFAGFAARIKLLRTADAYAEAAAFRTVRIASEPTLETGKLGNTTGLLARIKTESILSALLAERMALPRHVGIPNALRILTSSGYVARAHDAIYDVASYTATGRFRIPVTGITGGAQADLLRKAASTTNANFWVHLDHASGISPHKLTGRLSISGSAFSILGSREFNDGLWHWWAFGVQEKKTAYLMADEEVLGSGSIAGTPDTPTQTLYLGGGPSGNHFVDGEQCDLRIYPYYLSPDEIRSRMATRTDGLEEGPPIALWIHDDNTGAAVLDYSESELDGTIAGVEDTDFEWVASYLGTPEIAGKQYPYTLGVVHNAPITIIDPFSSRGIGRWGDAGTSPGTTDGTGIISARSRGTLLVGGGTDFDVPTGTGADATITFTGAEDEPLTFSHDFNTTETGEFQMYPSVLAQVALTDGHTSQALTTVMNLQSSALTALCPWLSGVYFDREISAGDVLQALLGGNGMSYREDREGNILFDFLTPPLGLGPHAEPVLDFAGWAGNTISWPDSTNLDISGSMTIAFWFMSSIVDQTTTPLGTFSIGTKGSSYRVFFELQGENSGRMAYYQLVGETPDFAYSQYGIIKPNRRYFCALVFDDPGNTASWYISESGTDLVLSSTTAVTTTPVTNSDPFVMGSTVNYSWGSVQHFQIWNAVKSLVELQVLMAQPPTGDESGLKFYAPMNEGKGAPVDLVSSTEGEYGGTTNSIRWAPKMRVDLAAVPSITLTELRRLLPVPEIVVKYGRNYRPLTPTELDTGVSGSERLDLGREWKEVVYRTRTPGFVGKSRRVVFETSIATYEAALKLLGALVHRLGPDMWMGKLTFPSGLDTSRIACGLDIGDEVGVTSPMDVKEFKVVAAAMNPATLSGEVVVWGKKVAALGVLGYDPFDFLLIAE